MMNVVETRIEEADSLHWTWIRLRLRDLGSRHVLFHVDCIEQSITRIGAALTFELVAREAKRYKVQVSAFRSRFAIEYGNGIGLHNTCDHHNVNVVL